jgi:putative CocE/NonD family hydrolase
MVKRWLTMPDGTRLATTIYMPTARRAGEQFPVVLELLPYRKDDTFYLMDYPTYSYFARHGYMTVKVDIRGTGASQGSTPPREYSDIELDDAVEIIRQLAEMPESNGNVAMWGISWSGFNSIQVAMRRPPQLKAIIAMHASDDLYHDDIHYVDGVLHLDPYHMFINHELGLPRTPRYRIDEDYFAKRFDREPWLLTYLSEQQDGDFWRRKSLRFQGYDKIDIPVYLIGGLNDGYRDTVIRMLENLSGPVRAEIGPWGHSSPDDGVPGPNFEWQDEAMEWLSPWLTPERSIAEARNRGSSKSSRHRKLMTFVRDGHEPDLDQQTSPGSWRVFDWPATGSTAKKLFLAPGGRLLSRVSKSAGRNRCASVDRLTATASSGTAAGWWWGETTADMRNDDSESLVYDKIVNEPIQIVGLPEVSLRVASKNVRANWSLRLEDVSPSGKVTLITGALINGAHLIDRLSTHELEPGKVYDLKTKLHFTTWTFQKGHRVRLAVSNAQFPMAWPSAEVVETELHTSAGRSVLTLPVVPTGSGVKPRLPRVAKKLYCPHGEDVYLEDGKEDSKREVIRRADGSVSFCLASRSAYDIKRRRFITEGSNTWTTNDKTPEASKYEGEMKTTIITASRKLTLKTRILVESDKKNFHVTVTRDLRSNGRKLRSKTWTKSIPRRLH